MQFFNGRSGLAQALTQYSGDLNTKLVWYSNG